MVYKYNISDAYEAAIGAFTSLLFVFVIRTEPGPFIAPFIGFMITLIWIWLIVYSLEKYGLKESEAFIHAIFDFIVCISVSSFLALLFWQINLSSILSFNIFGSPIIIFSWMALPIAVIFDIKNVKNILRSFYVS